MGRWWQQWCLDFYLWLLGLHLEGELPEPPVVAASQVGQFCGILAVSPSSPSSHPLSPSFPAFNPSFWK